MNFATILMCQQSSFDFVVGIIDVIESLNLLFAGVVSCNFVV